MSELIEHCRKALKASDETAKGATPGPWAIRIEGGRDYTDEYWSQITVDFTQDDQLGTGPGAMLGDHEDADADAEHIAANNPASRLALNAALRVVLDGIEATLAEHEERGCLLCSTASRAAASLTAIAEALGVTP